MNATVHSIRLLAADIKLAHSVFALPFALLASFLAAAPADGSSIDGGRLGAQLALVVLCMVAARTWAMLANRLVDREIDRANPRTARRALASGSVPVRTAIAFALASAAVFVAGCAGFLVLFGNPWPLWLAVPVLAWIGAYPYAKRFTSLCHAWLGASLAISPLAAAIAIDPNALLEQPGLWLLAGMVLGWVAGFDVLYALQDLDFDRGHGVFSLPQRLGPGRALMVSRAMHVAAAVCLAGVLAVDPRLGPVFGLGVAIAAGLLLWEHWIAARHGTDRITLAFFTINGVISLLLGGLGIADVLLA